MDRQRQSGLDFIRVFACLLVVCSHLSQRLIASELSGPKAITFDILSQGEFGVCIFFVLSGFLLALPFWRASDAGHAMPSIREYAVRRFARIGPGYYVCIAIMFGITIWLFNGSLTNLEVWRAVAGVFFVNSFTPITFFPVDADAPLWSIGVEVCSYVMLPLAMLIIFALPKWRVMRRLALAVVIGLVLIAHHLVVVTWPFPKTAPPELQTGFIPMAYNWMPQYHPLSFFAIFAIGSLAASISVLIKNRSVLADVVAALAFGAVVWTLYMRGAGLPNYAWVLTEVPGDFPAFPLLLGITIAALPHSKFLRRLTDIALIRFLAAISYGVYLYHSRVIDVLTMYAFPFIYRGYPFTPEQYYIACSAMLIVSVIVATISWYAIERPLLRAIPKLVLKRRSAPSVRPARSDLPAKHHAEPNLLVR
jgi:peptidoglycan/LPS O-acetylase OafA/YrhL